MTSHPENPPEFPLHPASARGSTRQLRMAPVECEHRRASHELILDTAASVKPGGALILGAGRCEEIPFVELSERFKRVVLNDIERGPLEEALDDSRLRAVDASCITLEVRDLTGVTDSFATGAKEVLRVAQEAESATAAMAELLDQVEPQSPSIGSDYDLVVASCLLSQLHVPLWHVAWKLFGERFRGEQERLRQSQMWAASLRKIAIRMEDRLLDDLRGMVAADGRIMLSVTVQCCHVEPSPDGAWLTPGWWRMTRSTDFSEIVAGRFAIVKQRRWPWVAKPPGESGAGRLYHVVGGVLASP